MTECSFSCYLCSICLINLSDKCVLSELSFVCGREDEGDFILSLFI